jgi:MFS family permease
MPLNTVSEKYIHKFSDVVRTTFSSIRHRNYRLFFTGQIISLIGTWLQNTALAWLVYTITHDARALGLMSFLGAVPVLLLGAYAGTIADEYPKRRILIITQSSAGILALVLALCVWQGWTSLWILGSINLLVGVVIAFDLPTRQAFVVEMVGKKDISNAIALNSAIFNGARLIGPAIGAAIIAGISIEVCFFLNGLSFIAVIIGLLMMRLEAPLREPRNEKISRFSSMKEGVKYLYMIPNYRALMVLVIGMTLFAWSYTVNLPVIAVEILHGDSATYGALLSANGLGALIAALTQAAFGAKMRPRYMLFLAITTFVIAMSLIPFMTTLLPILLLLGVAGWSIISFFITANSTLQRFVPDSLRGRVMGIYSLSFAGLFPFGSVLAGYLSHAYGVGVALWVDSVIIALIAIPTYLFVRTLPRLADVVKDSDTSSISVETYRRHKKVIA